ncbi:putative leucine-rich repeat-containing protein DDB_G0290503 isoform X1 [Polyergus mexicanus]|uniref:putative leucine-rich repeat-containing protein DDB_G0290503 isoform X1 n=1 Tax=Polyergus mexicanus TaxID=615972 RepID=UPI0038B59B9B
MHYQSYDGEEEFEPRIIPKPTAKLDCFAVPTVPEISLVFEKPMVQNLNDRCNDSSSIRLLKPIRVLDNIDNTMECINSTSSISCSPNSYAAWREQNYTREANSRNAMHFSPLCKNTHSCNRALKSNTSIQKQQEQDKICDMQKQMVNVKTNDGISEKCVKFTCPDMDNSYNHRGDTHSLPTSKSHLSCNTVQKAKFNVPDHSMRMPNKGIPDTLKGTEHLQMPYTGYQQFHASSHSNYNVDNNETVKTLLQLVNSQSEQIKNLQLQIDRLIRMQEESFRNKSTCSCSSALANQVLKYPLINCYDTALTSSLAQSQNKDMKKNEVIQNTSAIEKKDLNIFGENNKLETALLEQQSKKTFVEQKVSIGVMTSFEFTVQNSPFLLDSEIYEKKEVCRESNNINRRNAVNVQDTTEPVKRYKNTFTHKTGTAQLENIVEDSESYLSSNQQQSSNFNVSSSVRDSERHTLKESDIYNAANTSESSKKYQYLATDLNQKEMHKRAYTKEDDNTNEQVQDIRKMFNASMNVEYSPSASMNCNKMLVVNDENDYITINRKKNVTNVNANKHSLHNIHLPATDYYQNYRNKKHGTNTKQIQDVDDSMILSGGDLKIFERPPPTPEPSIHVEMQEYMSDDESDKLKHTPKIGWTFYDNVLGQVNEILQNSSVMNDQNQNNAKIIRKVEQENDMETETALNNVKVATLEQLRKLGISLTENKEYRESNCDNKMLDFDSSIYPRLDRQANMMHSVVNETNTSMHMKALALKYLSDEQLADIALHKEESSSLKHLMVSNMQGTNMSLATMHYLERYKILPGKNNMQIENIDQTYGEMASKHDFKPTTGKNNPTLRQFPFVQTPGTTCPSRILDLSTLKRQPKLL